MNMQLLVAGQKVPGHPADNSSSDEPRIASGVPRDCPSEEQERQPWQLHVHCEHAITNEASTAVTQLLCKIRN